MANPLPAPSVGESLKRAGQQLALDFPGQAWQASIVEAFREWCQARRGSTVVIEDFRSQVSLSLHPHSPKCWGSLPRLAAKAGLIRSTGRYAKARSPRTHSHPVAVYEVL